MDESTVSAPVFQLPLIFIACVLVRPPLLVTRNVRAVTGGYDNGSGRLWFRESARLFSRYIKSEYNTRKNRERKKERKSDVRGSLKSKEEELNKQLHNTQDSPVKIGLDLEQIAIEGFLGL